MYVWYEAYPFAKGTTDGLDIVASTTGMSTADAALFTPTTGETIATHQQQLHDETFPDQTIIDHNDSRFQIVSGNWYSSSAVKGYGDSTTLYSNDDGASVSWTPQVQGRYEVYLYKLVYPNSDSNTKVEVTSNNGSQHAVIDQNGQTGTSGWVDLGAYTFQKGTTDQILLTSGNGYARSDSVKLVKVQYHSSERALWPIAKVIFFLLGGLYTGLAFS